MSRHVVCLSVIVVVCDVLYCGKTVHLFLSQKLSEGANRVAPRNYPTIPIRTSYPTHNGDNPV